MNAVSSLKCDLKLSHLYFVLYIFLRAFTTLFHSQIALRAENICFHTKQVTFKNTTSRKQLYKTNSLSRAIHTRLPYL